MAARKKRWSQQVTENSDAMALADGVFSGSDPRRMAKSIKRSADNSHRRKSSPYRSAMSMITFFLNRGGKGLSATRRKVIEAAKDELRQLYSKTASNKVGPAKAASKKASKKKSVKRKVSRKTTR
jgi:putative cell wall-binding protein